VTVAEGKVRAFAEWAVARRGEPLGDEVQHGATRALVDWYAATVPGSEMEPARILRSALSFALGEGTAGLVPDGVRTDPRTAALVNGTASHTAELDDIFRDGIYHPGSPTVAAALALAEHLRSSGEELLRAIAIGYEISSRVSAAVQPAHYTYWHTTGTVGTLGAAAAAGELLGLDAPQLAHALANATTMAAGLQQAFRSDAMSKPLHAGHAAEAGLLAALTARDGFTGAPDILEGDAGFGAAMSADVDWDAAVAALGRTPWAVCQPTVKFHACCGHTFAAIDAALQLRSEGLDADRIESIDVTTYSVALKVAGNPDPHTAFEAKFSLAYTVAAALLFGKVRLEAFTDERLDDARQRALLEKVRVHASPEFDALVPGQRCAHLEVRLDDGTVVERLRTTRKGDPDDPLTDEELREKYDELVGGVVGADRAARFGEALWKVAAAPDVRAVTALLSENPTRRTVAS
jgi:2-methylcitrate dehydratase PrpD